MAHFAKIDENNIVTEVIVAEQDFIDSGLVGDSSKWIQTSYNTHGGVHLLGGTPFRKNFAGIGYTYDSLKDAFIPPKLHSGWILNEETCLWEPPIAYPNDGKIYVWDDESLNWLEQTLE